MIVRSLLSSMVAMVMLFTGHATAQVLLCPTTPKLNDSQAETRADARRLLERLMISLDLRGYDGIDVDEIMDKHAETPGALLAKLGNVADQCARADSDDLEEFYSTVPELRQALLEAMAAADMTEVVEAERPTDLSVRSLWRKLWFRTAPDDNDANNRWAVIVSSPEGDDEGWSYLGDFQETWEDVYFQLHEPYYDHSEYHAIIVGKKLPREEAERLLDYVKELGMAEDSYLWPVPVEDNVGVASSEAGNVSKQRKLTRRERELDISVLNN